MRHSMDSGSSLKRKPMALASAMCVCSITLLAALDGWGITRSALLKRTVEAWEEYQDYTATFEQTTVGFTPGETEVFLGKVWLCRKGINGEPVARLEYYEAVNTTGEDGKEDLRTGGLRETFIVHGDALYSFAPGDTTLTVRTLDSADPFGELVIILALLEIDPETLEEHYKMSRVTEELRNGHEVYHFSLEPIDPETSQLPTRGIWLDKKGFLPRRIEAYHGETSINIVFWTQETNTGLNPNDERISGVPDTIKETNDLREEKE